MIRLTATLALLIAPGLAFAEPQLRFERANEASEINRRLGDPKLTENLRLISMTSDEIKDLQIAVPDLRDADGHIVTLRASVPGKDIKKPIAIPGLESINLALTADLPELGVYTTNIILTYAGKRTITKLTIDRIRPKLELEVTGAPAARIDIAPWGGAEAHLDLALLATEGSTQSIDAVELNGWGIEDGSDRFQREGSVEVDGAPKGKLTIFTKEPKKVRAVFRSIDDAGRHKGTLRFANANATPLDLPVTIVARVHWLMAAILIAIGVWASYQVRIFLTRRRKNLVRRRTLEEARAELLGRLQHWRGSEFENALIVKLEQNYRDLAQKLERQEDDLATENEVNAFRAKVRVLDDWLASAAQLAKIRNAELATRVRKALQQIAGALSEAKTPEAVAEADKALRAIEINEQLITELTTRAAELRAELTARRATLSADAQKILDEQVVPRLDKIHPSSADPLDTLLRTLDEARRHYVLALQLSLVQSLAVVPLGFDDSSRALLEKKVRALLEGIDTAGADEAARRYEIAYRAYMTDLAAKLGDALAEVRTDAQNANPSDDELKLLADLDRRQKELAQLAITKPFDAAAPYAQLSSDVLAVVKKFIVGEKVVASGKRGELPARAAASALIPGGVLAGEETRRWAARPGAAATQAEIERGDVYVAIFTGFTAVLMGVRLLWASDPVWGGFEDYAVAFLWGAGLHQVVGAAFEGFQGVRTRLEAP